MQGKHHLRCSIRTAVVVIGVAHAVSAAPLAELTYEASPECPSQQGFVAAVASRGGHFDAKVPGETARTFAVTIRKDDSGYAGTLQIGREEAWSAPREVHGNTCDDVVDALAVVTAIELRPSREEVPAGEPAAPSAQEIVPVDAVPPTKGVTGFQGRSTWGPEELPVSAGTLRFKPLVNFTLSGGAVLGPVPKTVLPRYDLAFRLANVVTTPDGIQRLNGPILRARVSLFALPSASYRAHGTKTEVAAGVALGLGVCWSPHYDTKGLVLLGCGEFGYSTLALTPYGADGTKETYQELRYGTGGLLLETEYNLVGPLHIGARVGGDIVAAKTAAERADGSKVFDVGFWAVYGELGAGLHF